MNLYKLWRVILYKDDIVKFLVDADSSIPITNVLSFEEKNS